MTRAAVSRVPTCIAPSWLRYSTAPKPNRLPFRSGPPIDAGDLLAIERRRIQAAVGRDRRAPACASSRKNSDAEPCNASPPDRVTTLMAEPADRPRSAANRLVAIWNSCTPSWTMLSSGPPTMSSLLSMPSMVMLPPRPSCPADEMTTELVLVGSKFGAGALPGTSSASSMKLRPLSGSRSMDGRGDDRVDDRARGVDQAGAGRVDDDVLAHAGDGERRVEVQHLPDAQRHRLEALRRKAGGRDRRRQSRRAAGRAAGTARWCRWSPRATIRSPTRSPSTFAPGTGRDCGSRTRPRKVAVAEVWADGHAVTETRRPRAPPPSIALNLPLTTSTAASLAKEIA